MHRPHQDLQNMKFSCLYLFPFAHKVVPQFVPHFGPFLGPLKGPQIKSSHILMHRSYRDLHNLKFSCLYLIPFAHKVVPQKASGRGAGGRGAGGGGRVVYHTSTGGWQLFFFVFLFFFFFWIRGKIGRGID